MNKKTLFLMVALIVIPILIYVMGPKKDKQEPITIISHASYVTMSIDELVTESDLIVIGYVNTIYASRWNTPNGRRPEGDPAQKITPDMTIFTDMDFNITQLIKGDIQQKNARIRSLGGVVDGDRMIADKIIPKMNKTYLLFLDFGRAGSTANVVTDHYWITGGGFQGLYEIIDDRAISVSDEWALKDLIAYIQKSLSESDSSQITPTAVPTITLTEPSPSITASPETTTPTP
ncbi:MAG: hypothetical protein QY332_03160 [Anaerolineales bacterium]|nr:MAG: hypothetical protein QY332_03160 [Anaerolineales bacterium]